MTLMLKHVLACMLLAATSAAELSTPHNARLINDDLLLQLQAAESVSLHALPQPLVIELDLDADPATGDRGVDARITFSPERSRDGVRIVVIDPTGFAQPRTTLDADLAITPSFAATRFDVRIDPRRLAELAGVPYDGQVRVQIDSIGPAFADMAFTVAATDAPPLDARVPPKPADAIRVASFNVQRSAPIQEPEPFAQLMKVIDAEVYLLQEWDLPDSVFDDLGDPGLLTAWFEKNLGGGPWHAAAGPGGVAIVSRYPIEHYGGAAEARELRYLHASLASPLGTLTVASVHLKCCGSPGSEEDRTRIEQAKAIHADLLDRSAQQRQHLIVGGDLNLVGTRWPLLHIADHLDADGSDLLTVDTPVVGDPMRYTWRHPAHPFALGRLDYLLISDATLSVVHSFALDTLRLDPPPTPLTAATSSASDHLPIVVDVRAQESP